MQPNILNNRPSRFTSLLAHSNIPTVLLVDGNSSLAAFIQHMLPATCYHVEHVVDCSAAHQLIATSIPDLIVLNVDSVIGAFPWLACLKSDKTTLHIPVIMIAGHNHMPNLLCAIDLAADDYIPFEDLRTYLTTSITQLLGTQQYSTTHHGLTTSSAKRLDDRGDHGIRVAVRNLPARRQQDIRLPAEHMYVCVMKPAGPSGKYQSSALR